MASKASLNSAFIPASPQFRPRTRFLGTSLSPTYRIFNTTPVRNLSHKPATHLQPLSRRHHTPSACQSPSTLSDSDRTQTLLDTLSVIDDPDLHQNIVSLGFIKKIVFTPSPTNSELFDVSFDVQLTTPACPIKDQFRSDCKRLAEQIPWISTATVTMTAAPLDASSNSSSTPTGALDHVGAVVAVASCKGGVGKSTTAVNLAFALSAQGARVGIMDADIYGPSLPTLVEPDHRAVQYADGRIRPLTRAGVKLMSFGYVNPDSAIMRGPMIANVLNQLLMTTQWGALDYLIVDLPPGTGDIQLTLSQIARVTAAVIVTTPQRLAFVDVVKGIDMFDKVSVPNVAVVENMAYFEAPDSGTRHFIFGHGHRRRLEEEYGMRNAFAMPIEPSLSESSDSGVPFVEAQPDSQTAQQYSKLASCVVREVAKIKYGGISVPDVRLDETSGYIVVKMPSAMRKKMEADGATGEAEEDDDVEGQLVWPANLRRECRCAICVDEMTGRVRLDPKSVPEDVRPKTIKKVGNYAVEMVWDDGHVSLYPYSRFVDGYASPQERQKEESAESPNVAEDVAADVAADIAAPSAAR